MGSLAPQRRHSDQSLTFLRTLVGVEMKVDRCRRRAPALLLILLGTVWPPIALSHEAPVENPPASALWGLPAPLKGSTQFLDVAPARLKNRCDDESLRLLDEVERRLRDANLVRWGATEGIDPRAADYHRSKAEVTMLEVLGGLPDVIRINTKSDAKSIKEKPVTPRLLDQQSNSLLVEVNDGEEAAEFLVVSWDLTRESSASPPEIVVTPGVRTYALIQLENVPHGETQLGFTVRRQGETKPAATKSVSWRVRPWGQITLNFEEAGVGPTPALLSLRSVEGGVLWEPAGAIDFRPQLNDVVNQSIFEPGRGYMFWLPGERRGRFWIVPHRVEMAIPAGKWDVRVQRGPEHLPIRVIVEIAPEEWVRRSFETRRWCDMKELGWYSGDDHVHARLMSGDDADRLLKYVQAVDINVANILEMGDYSRSYYSQRGFGRKFRVQDGAHWLVPGQEDPRSMLGHAIGLNLQDRVRDVKRYLMNDDLARDMHKQGGLYGHTHVGPNACMVHREMALFTPMGIVDFNSIMQAALGVDLYYDFLNMGFRMTASAGADTPYGGTIGAVRVYAQTEDANKFDPDLWFDALKAGRTFVTSGPMLELSVEGRKMGETLEIPGRKQLTVRASARGYPGGSAPKSLRIVRWGETALEAASTDDQQTQLEVEGTVDSDKGCWIAAHAVGHDGSEAHSTPVYVSVAGGSHAASLLIPALVKKQLGVLDEIDAALSESQRLAQRDPNHIDPFNRVNAEQADAVRKRITIARQAYITLKAGAVDTLPIE
jgi:hypothetical protein